MFTLREILNARMLQEHNSSSRSLFVVSMNVSLTAITSVFSFITRHLDHLFYFTEERERVLITR